MAFLEFQVPTLIVYGTDSLIRLPELATPNSEKVVIVTDKKPHNSSHAGTLKNIFMQKKEGSRVHAFLGEY